MNNYVLYNKKPVTPDAILKVTALLYLQEALRQEQYEECPELVRNARKFGARPSEVRKAILEGAYGVKKGRPRKAKGKYGGRLRLY